MITRRRFLRFFLIAASLVLTVCSAPALTLGQGAVSNTDHAVAMMVAEADSVLKANQTQGFRIGFSQPTSVRLKLIDALIALGYRIYEMPTETTEITTVTIDPALMYRFTSTGKSMGIRNVDGTIGITLTQRDGSVMATHLAEVRVSESVTSNAADLDDGLWPMVTFVNIEDSRRRRGIKRILEPALLISTVAVTVFLLFNVRSQ